VLAKLKKKVITLLGKFKKKSEHFSVNQTKCLFMLKGFYPSKTVVLATLGMILAKI